MKVIYICGKSYYFTEGPRGRVIHAKGIVEGLLDNGCEVEVVSGPGISAYTDKHDGLTTTAVGEKCNNFLGEVVWRKKLFKYIKQQINKFDILILRYGFSNPILTTKISQLCHLNDCYSILEVNSLGTDYSNRFSAFQSFIKSLEVKTLSSFELVYVVSEEEKNRIKEVCKSINIQVIPNATHNKLIAKESESGLTRFVYLGRLNHYYNFKEVIQSFKAVAEDKSKNIELVIFGDGQNNVALKESASKDPRIKIMGEYENSTIANLVNRDTDILLLPYKKNTVAEIGSPMKLFEYMVLGAPILASNVGQIIDIIQHQENGYIYQAGDVEDLSEKMRHLIEHKKERKEAGYRAHQEAIKQHTWKKRMGKLLSVCNLEL